jgi:hypothetical protein
MLVKQEAYL